MKEYSKFPPYDYLKLVLDRIPETATLYIDMWTNRNDSRQYVVARKDIQAQHFISPTLFKNRLFDICSIGLIEVDETPQRFIITFIEHDE